jgi:hypothetical protein
VVIVAWIVRVSRGRQPFGRPPTVIPRSWSTKPRVYSASGLPSVV